MPSYPTFVLKEWEMAFHEEASSSFALVVRHETGEFAIDMQLWQAGAIAEAIHEVLKKARPMQ